VSAKRSIFCPPRSTVSNSGPERIQLDPGIHAAERANALVVKEGIPFREAYRRVGKDPV